MMPNIHFFGEMISLILDLDSLARVHE